MFSAILQIIIGISGCLAIYCLLTNRPKLGSIIGIAGQPFWIILSIYKGLWGVLVVSIAYLVVWTYGLIKDGK